MEREREGEREKEIEIEREREIEREYPNLCANLYINCVASTLPVVKLPQLMKGNNPY